MSWGQGVESHLRRLKHGLLLSCVICRKLAKLVVVSGILSAGILIAISASAGGMLHWPLLVGVVVKARTDVEDVTLMTGQFLRV